MTVLRLARFRAVRPAAYRTAHRPLALFAVVLLALGWPALHGDEKKETKLPDQVSYVRDIRPIFQQQCQGCHQPAKAEGSFLMTNHADLFKKGDNEQPGVVAGDPDKSFLVSQIVAQDGKPPAMPRGKDPLTAHQVALIKKWIQQGAKDDSPPSTRVVVDMEHPPVYVLPAVIPGLAYSPDGELLAVAGYHEVLLHKADGSGLVARLVGLSERVQSVAFSPDGKWLAVTGGSPGRFGEIQVWNVEKKQLKLSLPMTYDTVYGISWSSDGKKLAFGCPDNSIRAIEASSGKQIVFQGGHSDWVLGTCFSREDDYIVSVSRDMSMKLTEVATERLIDNVTSITPGALKGGLAAVARRPLKEKKMSKVPPDVKGGTPHVYDEVVCGGSDGTPRLYKIHRETKRRIGDDDNKLRQYASMPGRIYTLAFSADAARFVAGSSLDGTGEVRIYQADNDKFIRCEGQKGGVYTVAFRPDGQQVASAGFDGVVRLNDAQTGKLIREFTPCPQTPATSAKVGARK
ncbi:MAG TPA: c-type cytochrome domain-containing protein [Gemmataceae bacterium]|nr:c-type cytochrome domain-containing protein [Gemmataceae bacterium]